MITIIMIRARLTALYYKTLINLHERAMAAAFTIGYHAANNTKNLIRSYDTALNDIFDPEEPTTTK